MKGWNVLTSEIRGSGAS